MERKVDSQRTRVNKAKMLKHLKINLGNVRAACLSSGVKKSTFYDWTNNDAQFAEAVLNVYRGTENIAMATVIEKISDDPNALINLQRKQAKRIRHLSSH